MAGSGGATSAPICDGFAIPADHPNAATTYDTTADTVTDRVTGLMWQRTVAASDGFSWGSPPTCRRPQLGGFSDWRAPTIMELATIVDLAAPKPTIDATTFPATPTAFFGTSTGVYNHESGNNNWVVDFSTGMTMNGTPTDNYARCVRRQTPATCYAGPRFAVSSQNGVEVVADARTNLTWQRGLSPAPVDWAGAKAYCASLGGSFRVPSAKELLSIVDWTAKTAIDATTFPDSPSDMFWTATAFAGDASNGVTVRFGDATYTGTTYAPKTETHRVRCVM